MKAKNIVTALSALAQESRLAIFSLLMEQGEGGMAAGQISDALGIPATTASFHLSQLKNAGLLDSHKEGRSVIYAINLKKAKKLAGHISGKKLITDLQYEL